jgi:hypothetical protein
MVAEFITKHRFRSNIFQQFFQMPLHTIASAALLVMSEANALELWVLARSVAAFVSNQSVRLCQATR